MGISGGSSRSAGSSGSILSIGSSGSILSIGSTGSILSIGSAGSILSIGSAGSLACLLSVGSIASIGSVLSGFSRWSMLAWWGTAPVARGPVTRTARQLHRTGALQPADSQPGNGAAPSPRAGRHADLAWLPMHRARRLA